MPLENIGSGRATCQRIQVPEEKRNLSRQLLGLVSVFVLRHGTGHLTNVQSYSKRQAGKRNCSVEVRGLARQHIQGVTPEKHGG